MMRQFLLILLLLLPFSASAETIQLAAAASLRELATEAAAEFEQLHPEHQVLVNSASSGTLARQIAAGAPADLFISANPQWLDYLVQQRLVAADAPVAWASNRLVLVGRGPLLAGLGEVRGMSRLAIGKPDSVPAGRYARQLLEQAGLYRDLERAQRLVLAKDVRQALLYAEQGVVDAAIVYASDARLLRQATVVLTPPETAQPSISYPLSVTRQGAAKPAALALFEMLRGPLGTELLDKYGLLPLLKTGAWRCCP
jgi:molybdate transport system substrate-binding protein